MKVTRRQIRLVLREGMNKTGKTSLTEAELLEIAPVIGAIARVLGPAAARLGPTLMKGATKVGQMVSKSPKAQKAIQGLLKKSKDKLPQVSQAMDKMGIDLDNLDFEKLSGFLQNPPDEVKGELDKLFKGAGGQMEKAEECECPTPEEVKQAMGDIAEHARRRRSLL